MAFIATVLLIFSLLVLSEVAWRKGRLHNEFARKFVHITVGSLVAFWPYFLSNFEIKLLSVAFLVIVVLSRYFNIFQAIHSVQRPTRGEFWFALTVGILSFDLGQPHVYTAALLTMSLADGLAAAVGTQYGQHYRYSILGSSKTALGSLTFFVVSTLILVGYYLAAGSLSSHIGAVLLISTLATLLENVSARGLDNLIVPLFVAIALRYLS